LRVVRTTQALSIWLPNSNRRLEPYLLHAPSPFAKTASPARTRVAFAAAHVVADPLADDPWLEPAIDWESTLAYRGHLWQLGLSVAEAMDTAQRGMGLGWPASKELIQRALADARAVGTLDRIACGAGTDQLSGPASLDEVIAAYLEQCAFVESYGGRIILMASRALAATARGPDDYALVYDRVLSQLSRPVIIHWLGDMFDPALAGYWGTANLDEATNVCLDVLARHSGRIDGIKVSLLDADREVAMRQRLPGGVRMYTGDDFSYPSLIESGSDALLGIFDAIAPAAAVALAALDDNDTHRYHEVFDPTVALSRHIFQSPTRFYKTGIVFLAYLNGHQSHFRMVGGQESARSIMHLAELFRLADQAGLLVDPELACQRMRHVLLLAGIE
jgi:Protein of unknown function (DUF993)